MSTLNPRQYDNEENWDELQQENDERDRAARATEIASEPEKPKNIDRSHVSRLARAEYLTPGVSIRVISADPEVGEQRFTVASKVMLFSAHPAYSDIHARQASRRVVDLQPQDGGHKTMHFLTDLGIDPIGRHINGKPYYSPYKATGML